VLVEDMSRNVLALHYVVSPSARFFHSLTPKYSSITYTETPLIYEEFCSPVEVNRRFKITYLLHLQGGSVSQVTIQLEAGSKQNRSESSSVEDD
jgi:hypothetical protein